MKPVIERKEFISDEVVLPKIAFIKFVETIFAKKIAINSLCKKTSKRFSLIALEIFLMPVTPIIILITILPKTTKTMKNVEITIHMDPIDNSNPETKRLKEKCEEIARNINKEYSIHDFRVVYGTSHNNVIFDIVVPYGVKENEQSLTKIIEEKMNENEGIKINIVLHIDHPFSER